MSFHRPRLGTAPLWYPKGITFAGKDIAGYEPLAIFVDIYNHVYVVDGSIGYIRVWNDGESQPTTSFATNLSYCWSLFVTLTEDVYFDQGGHGLVARWARNSTTSLPVLNIGESCAGLFVDLKNELYCSIWNGHQVVKQPLQAQTSAPIMVAGTGFSGFHPSMLDNPRGLFLDTSSNLYVADCFNHRIQFFSAGDRNGKTRVGKGAPDTIELSYPTGITLDADGFLFVVDNNHHRIVGSDSRGFWCAVGCSKMYGANPHQMHYPYAMSFDNEGNILVADQNNHRIQKFIRFKNRSGTFQFDRVQSMIL